VRLSMPKGSHHSARVFPPLSISYQTERISANTEPGLGPPLNVGQVAKLIGCSVWTVRQTLMPRGLPFFRFSAPGRLIFLSRSSHQMDRKRTTRWIKDGA